MESSSDGLGILGGGGDGGSSRGDSGDRDRGHVRLGDGGALGLGGRDSAGNGGGGGDGGSHSVGGQSAGANVLPLGRVVLLAASVVDDLEVVGVRGEVGRSESERVTLSSACKWWLGLDISR